MAKNRLSNLSNTATAAEIHYRVGAEVDGGVQLLEFFVDIGRNRGIADVGVDLAARSYTDRHRLELRMIDVGGDDHAPGGDFIAHQLRSKLLFARNVFHLFGDHAAAGVVHLREVRVAASSSFCASPPQPLRTQLWHFVAVAGLVSALKVLGAHFVPLFLNKKLYAPGEAKTKVMKATEWKRTNGGCQGFFTLVCFPLCPSVFGFLP